MQFSHIYIEREAANLPRTQKILSKYPNSIQIEIDNYKNIFNRSNQNFQSQKLDIKLILAVRKDHFYYKGSHLTKNFDAKNYFYNSVIYNCIYNCEYCYLQGMYNSAHIVIFVNLDDFFYHTEALLKEINSLFLCISYETDLLGFENIIPYTREWIEFAKKNPNLTIEIRTKSNNYKLISDIKQIQNVILAWTLSPETTIDKFENNTPTLNRRIESLLQAIDDGWNVRICLDPVLYSNNWEEEYTHFINYVFSRIDSSKVFDLTLGVFRINSEYLKNIRKMRTDSKLVFFPYKRRENFSTYPVALEIKMKEFIFNKLVNYLPKEKIFL